MIWTWLAKLVGLFTAPLRAALPTVTLPFDPAEPTAPAQQLGRSLALVNSILPMLETMSMLTWVVTYVLPAMLAYTAANWVWRHIPELWGFGPGAG